MTTDRLRIIVLGYLVRGPLGGLAWHHLQYVLGLAGLGHDVFFVEDSNDYPSCYDPVSDQTSIDPTYGLAFAARAFERLGLPDRWAYYDAHQRRWCGPSADIALHRCAGADMVLNLSGVNPLRHGLETVPTRVLVDTDPVFTQVRHLRDPAARARAALHTAFFSFGENVGRPCCDVPRDGFPWKPTRQPIVLDAWSTTPGPADGPLTSVMQWDSYAPANHGGVHYGMKADSFGPYADLPKRCDARFELAMGSPATPRQHLQQHGWTIVDPREPTRYSWTYQEFIRRSRAEFSVAKHGYVVSRSGWFSERSAAYLASGRPVIVQDTGFSDWLPCRDGVLAFTTAAEAIDRVETLGSSYAKQCRKAREVAEWYFDSRRVLTDLINRATAFALAAVLASITIAGCGESRPTGPSPPPAVPQLDCHAINYPGGNGGERIQAAIDDPACRTVYISPQGPDAQSAWAVRTPIRPRSNQTLTSTSESQLPVLRAEVSPTRILIVDGLSDVTIRRLDLRGSKIAPHAILITGSTRITFTANVVAQMTLGGVMMRDPVSSAVTVSATRFEDNGFTDVRTQAAGRDLFHARVVVEDNSMFGTTYGIALANCGGSPADACVARNNQIKPKMSDPGTGVDLNHSHAAIVVGNRIQGLGDMCAPSVVCRCGRGLTVDDTQDATISGNLIEGCTADGILLANGAVILNRPWYVSGNTVSNNTVQNNSGLGLGSFRDAADSADNNVFNVFRDNRISGNMAGGCRTTADRNTFFGNGPQGCAPQSTTMQVQTRH